MGWREDCGAVGSTHPGLGHSPMTARVALHLADSLLPPLSGGAASFLAAFFFAAFFFAAVFFTKPISLKIL